MENNIEELKNIIDNYLKLKKMCNPNIKFNPNIKENLDDIYKVSSIVSLIKNDMNRIVNKLNTILI